jgi:hypothetical protein
VSDGVVETKRLAVEEYCGVACQVSAAATATAAATLATTIRHRCRTASQ